MGKVVTYRGLLSDCFSATGQRDTEEHICTKGGVMADIRKTCPGGQGYTRALACSCGWTGVQWIPELGSCR